MAEPVPVSERKTLGVAAVLLQKKLLCQKMPAVGKSRHNLWTEDSDL